MLLHSFSSSFLSFCLVFVWWWIVMWNWKLKWILSFQSCFWWWCFIPVIESTTWTPNQSCNNLLFCFTYCIENTIAQLLRLLLSVLSLFYSGHIPHAFSLTFTLLPGSQFCLSTRLWSFISNHYLYIIYLYLSIIMYYTSYKLRENKS